MNHPIRVKSLTSQADAEVEREALEQRIAKEIAEKHMSPPGALGLPPALEAKRLKYGICDEAFTKQRAAFDRVYVHQIKPHFQEEATYGGTGIWMPETAQKRELQESNRGVLISAGLTALDHLKSHGIEIGDTVAFIRFAIFHKPIAAMSSGHQIYLLQLRSGDIIDSEEIVGRLKNGELSVATTRSDEGVVSHVLVAGDGLIQKPQEPFMDESY